MNTLFKYLIALVIVLVILRKTELYSPEFLTRRDFLSESWNDRKEEKRKRGDGSGQSKPDVFNTCSPESFEVCAKVAMPHLSRY